MPKAAPLIRKTASFRAQQDTSLPIRTETFQGRDFLVVPVIALVEGVLQAMNAATPELALAEEFGKVPDSWNGRPIVMNHPVVDKVPVSANSPAVLDQYQFGYMFNTKVEDASLKTEAWIDLEKVKALGGEVESTVQRIQDDELVEVSTGLFTATETTKGRFNGRDYSAVWRNVLPDHLAFLSEGVLGACSGEDGCGVRANSAPAWGEFIMPAPKDDANKPALKADAAPTTTPKVLTTATLDVDAKASITISKAVLEATDCGCDGKPTLMTNAAGEEVSVQHDEFRFIANSVPGGMVDQDIRKLLSQAIRAIKPYRGYGYCIHFTTDKVIYETYSYDGFDDYATYQRSYSIDESSNVTLGDDVERVNLLTQVVPVSAVTAPILTDNNASTPTTEDPVMPVDNVVTTPAAPESVVAPVVAPVVTPVEPVVAAAAVTQKVLSAAEYVAQAPAEIQEVLQSGIRMHNAKKGQTITALKASGRCKFSDDHLNAQTLETLEMYAELAAVPTYEGLAPAIRDNSADTAVPAAPRMTFN